MRRALSLAIVPLVGLLAFPAAAPLMVAAHTVPKVEDAVIVGVVRSAGSAGLSSASVYIEKANLGTLTKDDGTYRLVVPGSRIRSDSVTLTTRLVGFKQQSKRLVLRAGRTDTVDFVLDAQPIKLGEVVVSGQAASQTSEKLGMTINAPVDAASAGGLGGAMAKSALPYAPPPTSVTNGLDAESNEVAEADEVLVYSRADAKDGGRAEAQKAARSGAQYGNQRVRRSTIASLPPATRPLPPVSEGTLLARHPDGELAGQFPLKHTQVSADISGYLARTTVT